MVRHDNIFFLAMDWMSLDTNYLIQFARKVLISRDIVFVEDQTIEDIVKTKVHVS